MAQLSYFFGNQAARHNSSFLAIKLLYTLQPNLFITNVHNTQKQIAILRERFKMVFDSFMSSHKTNLLTYMIHSSMFFRTRWEHPTCTLHLQGGSSHIYLVIQCKNVGFVQFRQCDVKKGFSLYVMYDLFCKRIIVASVKKQ